MRETREREKRKEDAELLSVYVTQKACAHAHNFVRSATKSALTAVLPLRSGRSAIRLAQLVRSGRPLSFFFAKLPYSKIVAAHRSFKKKTTTTTEDPQSKK
jgi:hypothetical protein